MNGVLPPQEELMGGGEELMGGGEMPQGVLPQGAAPQMPQQMPQQGGGALDSVQAPVQATQEGGNRGYNGTVMVEGNPINVVEGMAEFNGEQYFVNADGSFVVDRDHAVVGRVVDGEFIPIDEAYLEELRANGILEE